MTPQHPAEFATVGDVHRALDERHTYLLRRFGPFQGAVGKMTTIAHTVLRDFCQSVGIDFDRCDEVLPAELQREIRILLRRMTRKVNTKLIKLSGAYNPEEN